MNKIIEVLPDKSALIERSQAIILDKLDKALEARDKTSGLP